MKKTILSLLYVLGCALPAQAYIDQNTAVLRIMNKAAGKTQTISIPVGQTARFEKLDITIRACKQTDPFQAEDFLAFTEIVRNGGAKIYSNWLSRNEPGDNPVQDADYDVWLVKCE